VIEASLELSNSRIIGTGVQAVLHGQTGTRLVQEFVDATAGMLRRPARSGLVLLAYVLGVAALVAAMGVMSSTSGQIVARLTDAGSSRLRVTDMDLTSAAWADSGDQAAQIEGMEGVVTAVPVRTFALLSNTVSRIDGLGDQFDGHLLATDERYLLAQGMAMASGSWGLLSNSWQGAVVVAGSAAAGRLGLSGSHPGISLMVNHRSVDVAGVLSPSGDSNLDDALIFSPATITYLADQVDNFLLVDCQPGYAEPLAKAIPLALMPDNPGQIGVSVVAQLAQLQLGINGDLSQLLATIGWVILALSALAAGTTMFLSVQQRSPEIALRRAMGASRGSIRRIFTYEGVLIGVCGGVMGSAVGEVITWVVARANAWPLCLGVTTALSGVALGLIAGVMASLPPAIYAANQQPAQILRTV
jgi:macrolide transport system ATP-binding/permease protein